ncbi:glycosylphosphatidylinositol anchor attachment 1 protein [Coccinella septempunctata]|uniref:glycosylphosphatidylinositol anchor attachment 1 protein n=1 Tax=Coccinella septempunctata TaxID=41139 RepID=UPI001D0899CC|nr:glycosylphosphatidylinositol anchor attachment 1 protein [Coccinella septempunctata]
MGLLTDPNCDQGKLTKALLKYYNAICILFYLAGITCFLALASREVSNNTYFSENALLAGLVKSQFADDPLARLYYNELQDEMKKYDDSLPYPWLLAKFQQIGLDTYTHNFSLHPVLGKSKKFSGKNVYGILRAPRAASTESLILSVPYRPPSSPHLTTAPSIAMLLAFANFASKEKYWAKDIIFLITEHEQLGIQAWLEAYHQDSCGSGVLESGDLEGRAGSIQAAINLELHTVKIAHIDIKIEGLNGQLPNLDLFNLVTKICTKEGVFNTFKMRENKEFRSAYRDWLYSFNTLFSMVTSQATGIPDGNHGLFHRFGIEAVTIEGHPYNGKGNNWRVEYLIVGRILEGVFRSLNNLLEKFHQSFFFYLLTSSNRYVSIGHYFPSIAAIAGVLYLRACAKWCNLQKKTSGKKDDDDEEESKQEEIQVLEGHKRVNDVFCDKDKLKRMKESFDKEMKLACAAPEKEKTQLGDVLLIFLLVHCIGIFMMNCPKILVGIGEQYDLKKETSLFYGYIVLSFLTLALPIFVKFKRNSEAMTIFNVLALLELGTLLICVGMNNFSLAILTGILYTPFALFINNSNSKALSIAQKVFWLLLHPQVVLLVVTVINSKFMFPNQGFEEIFKRGIVATQQALIYSIVDSMIYGNWLFNIVTAIFIPNWLCFWILTFSPKRFERSDSEIEHEKTD